MKYVNANQSRSVHQSCVRWNAHTDLLSTPTTVQSVNVESALQSRVRWNVQADLLLTLTTVQSVIANSKQSLSIDLQVSSESSSLGNTQKELIQEL